MQAKKLPLFLSLLLILASCGGKKTPATDTSPTQTLSDADIFNKEVVLSFVKGANENIQQDAKKEFLTGVDEYRNKKNLDKAVTTFRHSLTIFPFAKTYYELGNAYMDLKKYTEATDAYKMAEALQFDPISKVLYNLACAYSMQEKETESIKYLQLSIENGYTNLDHIMTDEDLTFARTSPGFNDMIKTSMGANTSSDEVVFTMYKSHFDPISLPYQLDEKTSQKINFDLSISYDYEKFVPGMVNSEFSRDVGDEYFYVGKLKETDNYVALIYSQAGMWSDTPPVHIYVATYKPVKGEMIDVEKIAGMEYFSDSLRTVKIGADENMLVSYYIQQWEKNPDDVGYENNKRTGLQEVAQKTFRIDDAGNIREVKALLGYRK